MKDELTKLIEDLEERGLLNEVGEALLLLARELKNLKDKVG